MLTLSITQSVTDTVPETLERSLGKTVMVPETVTRMFVIFHR